MIIAGGIAKMMKEKEEKREFWLLVLLPLWDIFGALSQVHFIHTIYRFEAWEVRSPTLQMVSKSELKRKSYGHYKKTTLSCKKISHRAKQGAKILHCANQGAKILHCANQGAKIFAPCKTTSWHTSAISHTSSQFLHRAKQGAKISHNAKLSAKLDSRCEILILRCENFATIGHVFGALPGAQIMHMICRFEACEVRNPWIQTVHDLDLKRRSYGHLKTTMQSWKEMLQPHQILLLLDTFLEHFLELKLFIPYIILNLRKSVIQSFKRYVIWIWNEEVMAIRRHTAQSWAGISHLEIQSEIFFFF